MPVLTQIRQFFRALVLGRPQWDGGVHPFDRRHGVDTSGLLYARDLPTGHVHDDANEGYYATAPSLFRRAVALWQTTLAPQGNYRALREYSFVDLGCGKGRALMLAAEYPFRALLGVELHPELARTARRNLNRWMQAPRACSAATIMTGDVLDVELPEGPVLLYLFNSFDRTMVRRLVGKLEEAARNRSAPLDVIYLHPDQGDVFEKSAGCELLADAVLSFSEEDARADAFNVTTDQCTLYRFRNRG